MSYLAPEAKMSTVLAPVKHEITERKITAENMLPTILPVVVDMLGSTKVGVSMINAAATNTTALPKRCSSGPRMKTLSSLENLKHLLRKFGKYYVWRTSQQMSDGYVLVL